MMRNLFHLLHHIMKHPLNERSRSKALGRFMRWQLATRLLPGAYVVPFVDGTTLTMERGMTGATGNWYCGLHEAEDMAFVLHTLRPDDLFVDVGANVGSYTVLASGAVGARSIAFEPTPSTFDKLMRNISVNKISDRVEAYNMGAGAREETLQFTAKKDTTNHVITGTTHEETIEIQAIRVDDILTNTPRIIKIDVEGWEQQVLLGMPKTLADPELVAVIAESNDSAGRNFGAQRDSVTEIMADNGFSASSYDPLKRQLLKGGTAHNTIWLRNISFVEERTLQAPTFKLVNRFI